MPDDEPDRNAHAPQLDEPLRSRERAALEFSVERLKRIHARAQGDGSRVFDDALHDLDWIVAEARIALGDIAALVPEAAKPQQEKNDE